MTMQTVDLSKAVDDMTEEEKALFALEIAGESSVQTLFAIVHNRFATLQEKEGFNQQKLADRMGLTRSQVSRWMASPTNMTLRSAAKLLMAMGQRLRLSVE
jgi:DNA-binding phage protein